MDWKSRLVLFTYFALYIVDQPAPEVRIKQGILRGKVNKNGQFYEYLGIPYGTTNKDTRFQAPQPPPSWKGVYKAVDEHHGCPQKFLAIPTLITGKEDCLKINVYVPATVDKPRPVMVYIHGGAFVLGSGGKLLYGPDFIVKHDVILVTFNYRLGALGFLCLGIKEAPGNAGLKDQIAALRWVKQNIASFGGDPDNVTLFGESAGGTSTSLLLISEAAKGLFHKAIIQSGSSISHWSINRYPLWTASLLAKEFGHEATDPYELYNFFKNLPYDTLTQARVYKPWEKFFETQLIHLPCVEKNFSEKEQLITDLPYNILLSRQIKIPVMLGFNDKEGIFMISREDKESLEARNKGYLFSSDLQFQSEEDADVVAMKIKELYFGNDPISNERILDMINLYTDIYFGIPGMLESEILSNNNEVYNYIFKYAGHRNVLKLLNGYRNTDGACHGDELFYLFNSRIWPFWINNKDQLIIDRLTTMWTNFAKSGNPTPQTSKETMRWEPSRNGNLTFLHIDDELKMGPVPNKEVYDVWRGVYSRYRRKQGNIQN